MKYIVVVLKISGLIGNSFQRKNPGIKIPVMVCLAAVIVVFSGCGKKDDTALKGTVTFITGEVSLNKAPASLGNPVIAGDEISTGAKSMAVIQFSETALITVKSNTLLKIDTLIEKNRISPVISLSQSKGSTFNKIFKSGTDYRIKLPTVIAAVRGTSFEISTAADGSKISLLTGKMQLVPIVNGNAEEKKAAELLPGNSIIALEEKMTEPEKMKEEETATLQLFDKIALVPVSEKEKAPASVLERPAVEKPGVNVVPVEIKENVLKAAEKEPTVQISKEKKDEIKKGPMTLDQIKEKHGTLSVVKTKDGREFIGAFSQEGETMRIFTVKGQINIKMNEVDKISLYRK